MAIVTLCLAFGCKKSWNLLGPSKEVGRGLSDYGKQIIAVRKDADDLLRSV